MMKFWEILQILMTKQKKPDYYPLNKTERVFYIQKEGDKLPPDIGSLLTENYSFAASFSSFLSFFTQ